MADEADHADRIAEFERARGVSKVVATLAAVPRQYCIDCGVLIPERRRKAMSNVKRCMPCQEEFEGAR
jgi:RNA polymerase-binding transcription factor DksA